MFCSSKDIGLEVRTLVLLSLTHVVDIPTTDVLQK